MHVDPLGKVLAEGGEKECFVSTEIYPGLVESIREDFIALDDRVLK